MGGPALQWPLSDNRSRLMGIKFTIPTCLATFKYESNKMTSVSSIYFPESVQTACYCDIIHIVIYNTVKRLK